MFNFLKPRITDEQVKNVLKPMLAEFEERVNLLQSMQKLEVKKGDIIVFRHPRLLSDETQKTLREALRESIDKFGHKPNVLLLQENMKVEILSRYDDRAPQ